MKAYYLTGACLGAVYTGEHNSPDLSCAHVCYRKNLLKAPSALDGPENSCTIHGPVLTSSKPPPKQDKIRTKEMSFYCRKTEKWREKAGGGRRYRWVHSRGFPGPVSVTEHSGHPIGRSWRHGGGQAALAELCA